MTTIISLDASEWTHPVELYDALLPALKSPSWHGASVAAVIHSLVYGEISEIKPPLRIRVRVLRQAPVPVRKEVEALRDSLSRAKAERLKSDGVDREIEFEIDD